MIQKAFSIHFFKKTGRVFLFFISVGLIQKANAQLTTSPVLANFFQVDSKIKDSVIVTFQNQYGNLLTVTYINFFHSVFSATDTSFSIPAGGSHAVTFYCDALHNLNYMDYALVECSTHPGIAGHDPIKRER